MTKQRQSKIQKAFNPANIYDAGLLLATLFIASQSDFKNRESKVETFAIFALLLAVSVRIKQRIDRHIQQEKFSHPPDPVPVVHKTPRPSGKKIPSALPKPISDDRPRAALKPKTEITVQKQSKRQAPESSEEKEAKAKPAREPRPKKIKSSRYIKPPLLPDKKMTLSPPHIDFRIAAELLDGSRLVLFWMMENQPTETLSCNRLFYLDTQSCRVNHWVFLFFTEAMQDMLREMGAEYEILCIKAAINNDIKPREKGEAELTRRSIIGKIRFDGGTFKKPGTHRIGVSPLLNHTFTAKENKVLEGRQVSVWQAGWWFEKNRNTNALKQSKDLSLTAAPAKSAVRK